VHVSTHRPLAARSSHHVDMEWVIDATIDGVTRDGLLVWAATRILHPEAIRR
jgi:hypothetical protein